MQNCINFIFIGLLVWFLVWIVRMWWYINKWLFMGMIMIMILMAAVVGLVV